MYSALTVAEYVIKYSSEHNLEISNLRLQKLLYFLQADFLISKAEPCFRETIEAWDFGPVVPVVYHRYKIFGGSNIPYNGLLSTEEIAVEDKEIINTLVDDCSGYSTSALVKITHSQSPWINSYSPYVSNPISNESIKEFFS